MKKILLMAIALCFVFAGSFETFSQTRTVVKKTVKRKLVKCRMKGKIVYRAKCTTVKKKNVPVLTNQDIPIMVTTGVGQGSGNGTGRGEGLSYGTGQGSGTGNGSGMGNGIGSGNTDKEKTDNSTLKTNRLGAMQPLKILSKPRPVYTDLARKNQVQGTVVLKITFLASGTIGFILPVKGLPDGLTEQAIAAARGIRFEPAKKNGIPVTVTKTVEYFFTTF